MAPEPDNGDQRLGRRGFFTQGFRNLLKPLADVVEKKLERLDLPADEPPPSGGSSSGPGPGQYGYAAPHGQPAGYVPQFHSSGVRLRPPGALPEGEFLARCSSCGKCAEACPVRAIQLLPEDHGGGGLRRPSIDPARQACVVCNDLSCMKVCPTGALQLVAAHEIRMGLAVLKPDLCVRTRGEDCQICVDKCPLGTVAIEIPFPGAPVNVRAGCTGCGVCQMYCPTEPRAIVIEPRES